MISRKKTTILLLCGLFVSGQVTAGAYIFSSAGFPDTVTHPSNFTGAGGVVTVNVCLSPDSESIPEMQVPIQNVIRTWNGLVPQTGNLLFGGNNNIPSGAVDMESTLLHEVGHCIGLAHPNAATESGLTGANRNYTKAAVGPNTVFDIQPGVDGVIGSADDQRGDDINLHWFRRSNNNPFTLDQVVDSTTYSRSLADLPAGDDFAANADRAVSGLLGVPNSEAVMQQGAFSDEDQRQLGHDDVATLRLAMSGVDEIEGTADDYTFELVYDQDGTDCDITIEVSGSSFAFCSAQFGGLLSGDHVVIGTAEIFLGSGAGPSGINWFFNQIPNVEEIFEDEFEAP